MKTLSMLLVATALTACAVSPTPAPTPSEEPVPTLVSEQRRLQDLLRGTPVVVTTVDNRLRVEVPLQFSFDAGRGAVKPALAAVLDRMATGLRRAPFEIRIGAPVDTRSNSAALVQDRAASVRDYLVARGVPVGRFVSLGRSSGEFVEVLVAERAVR